MPAKPLPGPSRLSRILFDLNRSPKPTLSSLKTLNLSVGTNSIPSVRYFVKNELPRIRFANQDLNIHLDKIPATSKTSPRGPEMILEFRDGKRHIIALNSKGSSVIFEELMDSAGGERWRRYKSEKDSEANAQTIVIQKVKATRKTTQVKKFGVAAALP